MHRQFLAGLLLLVITSMMSMSGCWAGERRTFSGTVVGISDGDTLTILQGKATVKVRVYGIDCPERGQDFATRARTRLAGLSYRQQVTVQAYEKDKYGRLIGRIATDANPDVGLTLVAEGLCWWYERFAPRDAALEAAQRTAKERRLGVWSRGDSVPPWTYRKFGRKPGKPGHPENQDRKSGHPNEFLDNP